MSPDDMRGEHLLQRVAGAEGGPGGGDGGEAFVVFRLGLVWLGADGANQVAEQIAGEGVVRVDFRGLCNGGHAALSFRIKDGIISLQ